LPSFTFKVISGPQSVGLPPLKQDKYIADGKELAKIDWKALVKEARESPFMIENIELTKRVDKNTWLLIAALKRKNANVE